MLPTVLGAKAHGAIMGLGNIYPNALADLFYGSQSLLPSSKSSSSESRSLEEMTKLQGLASEADWAFVAVGIPGTKWYLQKTRGYGGACRLPILPLSEEKGQGLLKDERINAFMEVEKKLESQNGSANGNGH
jgi:4-hydroxy-2-oxoglutarate aldolase